MNWNAFLFVCKRFIVGLRLMAACIYEGSPIKSFLLVFVNWLNWIKKKCHISEEPSVAAAHLDGWHRGRDTDSASKISSTQWVQSPAQSELQSHQANTGSAVSRRAVLGTVLHVSHILCLKVFLQQNHYHYGPTAALGWRIKLLHSLKNILQIGIDKRIYFFAFHKIYEFNRKARNKDKLTAMSVHWINRDRKAVCIVSQLKVMQLVQSTHWTVYTILTLGFVTFIHLYTHLHIYILYICTTLTKWNAGMSTYLHVIFFLTLKFYF